MTINITGLSPRQCLFADILWACQGQRDVRRFIDSLPAEFQQDAQIVLDMMVAAVFDDINDTDTAEEFLNRYRKD